MQTYTLSDIQAPLAKNHGALPHIGCTGPMYNATAAGANSTDNGKTVVDEVWYYMWVYGRPQDGHAVPTGAGSFNTTCATTPGALHYYERTSGSTWNSPAPRYRSRK